MSSKNIPYLDGWRGLAIVLVLQSHFLFGGAGRLGVALFFVLSGYLMSDLLFLKQVALPTFFVRRASRILPSFWVFTLLMVVWAAYQPQAYTVPLDELLATLAFVRTYLPSGLSIWADRWPMGHFWSLNVEEHSYVVLALLALLARRRRAPAALLLGAATLLLLLVTLLYIAHPPAVASPWFARSECAALGLVASATLRVWRAHSSSMLLQAPPALLSPLALMVGSACLAPAAGLLLNLAAAPLCLAVAVNYLDRAPSVLQRLLSLPTLRWCGVCSFSLYIWQQPMFMAYQYAGWQRQLAGLAALACGTAAFYWLERPARLYLNQRWGGIRPVRAPG